MRTQLVTLIVALTLGGALAVASEDSATVPYPKGYRDWTHVKAMILEAGHPLYESFGGIHHLYANDKAMQGYRKGTFPDGSVIVFDLLEAVAKDHAVTEGSRKVLGVMHRDHKRWPETGGWGFEGFAAGDAANPVVGAQAATACFACHAAQKNTGYVFSRWRD